MKNYEKYAEKIREYKGQNFCKDFVKPNILKSEVCGGLACGACYMLQPIWLLEDYEKPEELEIDWSKIKVDTPILVRQGKNGEWLERHFAKYENGDVYAWVDGQTSWTEVDEIKWKYAKLVEDQKEPKIDWSKVPVDTPVLVRGCEDEEWKKMHFAECILNTVYVWEGGKTSWTTDNTYPWEYAKLAESEEE